MSESGAQIQAAIDKLPRKEGCQVRVWPGGQRASELGYADGSSLLRVAQWLEAAARKDAGLRKKLDELRSSVRMSSVTG